MQSLTDIGGGMPGPGGVSGADDDNGGYYSLGYVNSYFGLSHSATSTSGYADAVFVTATAIGGLASTQTMTADGYTWAAGMEVESSSYAYNVGNAATGTITATASGDNGYAWGIYAVAPDAVSEYNDGTITVTATGAYGTATGLFAYASDGTASADNSGTGTISASATGYNSQAFGMYVSGYGDSSATNSGAIINASQNYAPGSATIRAGRPASPSTRKPAPQASITAATDHGQQQQQIRQRPGRRRQRPMATRSVTNSGDITATSTYYPGNGYFSEGTAVGVGALSSTGMASVDNNVGLIHAYSSGKYGQAIGIYAAGGAGADVSNSGDITATTFYGGSYAGQGSAIGVAAFSYTGPVGVDNSGSVYAGADGLAIGLYGYSYDGDVSITNTGMAAAYSIDDLADGIFASGVNVDVTNTGYAVAISNNGYFAAGIEAQGDDLTTVVNDGTVIAYTSNIGAPGYAGAETFGIYATGGAGGVQVTTGTTSAIQAVGPYATGIYVQSGGPSTITNAGLVSAGGAPFTYYATGIHAGSNYPGGDISVDNSGSIGAKPGRQYRHRGVGTRDRQRRQRHQLRIRLQRPIEIRQRRGGHRGLGRWRRHDRQSARRHYRR